MKYTKPRIIGRLRSPKAGFWRAQIGMKRILGYPSDNLITLLVTIVSAQGTKTIGWTCRQDHCVYHGVDLPVGTKLVLVRLLQNYDPDLLDIKVTWLGAGLWGRLKLRIADQIQRGLLSADGDQKALVIAINQLPQLISNRCDELREPLSTLSILVPSRDHPNLLEALYHSCFKPLLDAGGEVIIVDHASVLPETAAKLAQLMRAGCRVTRADGPFNYSRLINHAASFATRSRYLIVNDDVSPIKVESFLRLATLNCSKYQSIFAPMLVYPSYDQSSTRIQHAGVFLGMGGLSGHWLRHTLVSTPEAVAWQAAPRIVDALTGAIMLVDAGLFQTLGGFDEKYHVECSDIDFCLRATKVGWQNILIPDVVWSHPESTSRGNADGAEFSRDIQRDRRRFWLQWRDAIAQSSHLPKGVNTNSEVPKMVGHY